MSSLIGRAPRSARRVGARRPHVLLGHRQRGDPLRRRQRGQAIVRTGTRARDRMSIAASCSRRRAARSRGVLKKAGRHPCRKWLEGSRAGSCPGARGESPTPVRPRPRAHARPSRAGARAGALAAGPGRAHAPPTLAAVSSYRETRLPSGHPSLTSSPVESIPASASTSLVCWPSVGAGREIAHGVFPNAYGGLGSTVRPAGAARPRPASRARRSADPRRASSGE